MLWLPKSISKKGPIIATVSVENTTDNKLDMA